MNNFNLQVQDYQIIKKAALEFVPGLNVIVGPSNNGKTSILKAAKAYLYTVPGTTSIRAGTNNYKVGINYNGHTAILQKGLKDSVYLVDGEKYTKFGTTTPQVVSDAFNIKELELNGNKEQLNFWDQMNYPFLLDKSGVELFRFIIDSGENDRISKALRNMVSDRQAISKNIDMLQGSINIVDTEIDTYTTQLENAKSTIDASIKIIELQSKVAKLNLLKETYRELNQLKINKLEIVEKTKFLYSRLEILKTTNNIIKNINTKLRTLNDYFFSLGTLIGDISDIKDDLHILETVKNSKPKINQNLPELKNIRNKVNYITEQRKCLKIHSVAKLNYSKDKLLRMSEIKSMKNNIKHIEQDLSSIVKNIEDCNLQVATYSNLRLNFDICPYCGHKLND